VADDAPDIDLNQGRVRALGDAFEIAVLRQRAPLIRPAPRGLRVGSGRPALAGGAAVDLIGEAPKRLRDPHGERWSTGRI